MDEYNWKVLDIDYMTKTGKIRFKFIGTLDQIFENIGNEKDE